MKIVFFGGRHVHVVARNLNENFGLSLVITTDRSMVGFCKDEDIPYTHTLEVNKDIISRIKEIKPDIGVVADFGIIISKEVIDIFPNGILNVHPSLLPKYRGPTPVQSAILNEDKITGISIIKIDEQLDHGPILYQEEYSIKPKDHADQLLLNLFKRSAEILPEIIDEYINGEIEESMQDDTKATYTNQLKKENGYVNLNNPPKKEKLKRMIIALTPWPGVWTRLRLGSSGQAKIIKLLPNKEIQVEGKRPMTYKDFINGYKEGKLFLEKLSLI